MARTKKMAAFAKILPTQLHFLVTLFGHSSTVFIYSSMIHLPYISCISFAIDSVHSKKFMPELLRIFSTLRKPFCSSISK